MPFGIDFGTTNSALTEYKTVSGNKSNYGPGENPFPSLVAIDKLTGQVRAVGREVREKRAAFSETCEIIASIKTLLGEEFNRNLPGGWNATRVAGEIFKSLVSYADDEAGVTVKEAVVAIPVGFAPKKRQALREAAKMA